MHKIYLPIITLQQSSLKSSFARHGIRFGFAVGGSSFENPITRRLIEQHASIVATENALKMEYTQPYEGVFNFTKADDILRYSNELNIGVYGHALSWSLQNPHWLNTGEFTAEQLEVILKQHVSALAARYGSACIALDAANEGFVSKGAWAPMGNDYINVSLEYARHDCPVIYNSFFPSQSEYWQALVLLDAGKIDAIGIQLHLHYTDWEYQLRRTEAFLQTIRNRGGWARFSEVGVLAPEPLQSTIYKETTKLALKYKDIVRDFVVWGIKDPAWRGDVTLFDKDGIPKPAYWAVMDAL